MKYDNRLRRLEKMAAPLTPPHIVVRFVDPQLGVVSVLDRMTDTWFERDEGESEQHFVERVRLAVNDE